MSKKPAFVSQFEFTPDNSAVVIALGQGVSGMMASDDGLAARVLAAADGAGERMWRLPLHDEYKDGLKSDVADLNNISSQRGAGAIVAARIVVRTLARWHAVALRYYP